ncbi:MAG: hypothetical protein ACYS1A_12175 [Planctomycetota bacterium]
MGVLLEEVDFALMLMKVSNPYSGDSRSWTALKADVGNASFVGLDGLGLSLGVTELAVMVNRANGLYDNGDPNTAAVNFQIDGGYTVDLGGGNTVDMDFAGDLLELGGTIEIGLDGFVYLSGYFAFNKSSDPVTVVLADIDPTNVNVEILTVAARDATAFAE